MRRDRQRRDGQGRHLLPADRQEAHPRPGDRRAEPAALPLSGGFRRCQPAAPGRGVPRPRAFWAHLLQPGAHVGEGHRADRRGDGVLHGGRRLCAGDVRRDHHREGAGHDIPGRPAAGEGRDRRGGERGGAGRRRRAHAAFGRCRPHGGGRCRCDPPGAGHRGPPRRRAAVTDRAGARACLRPRRDLRHRAALAQDHVQRARGDRADRGRQRLRRVQGPLRRYPGDRLRPHWRAPGRHPRTTASSSRNPRSRARTSSSSAVSAASRYSSCRTSWASWWASATSRAASPRTGPSWSPRSRARPCPSSRSSSAAATAPGTTACAGAPSGPASSGCGPTHASR